MNAPVNAEEEWWMVYPKRSSATVNLFLFPYAGCGPNTFALWAASLPTQLQVCVMYLPGRLGRTKFPLVTDWRDLSRKLGDAIIAESRRSGRPYLVYGHSFGALLAYLTLVYVREQGGPLPVALVVGSKCAPSRPHKSTGPVPAGQKLIHDFSPDEMRAHYMDNFAHGAPKDYLKVPGMIDLICRPLQMDLGMNEKYWWGLLSESEQRPFAFDVHACFGEKDHRNTEDDLLAWEAHTTGRFEFHSYGGDHFFLHDNQNVGDLLSDLSDIVKLFI